MSDNNDTRPQSAVDAPQWREEWVPLASIIKHGHLQVRRKLDQGAVKRYADMTRAGSEAPPIKVGRVKGAGLYLVDGWHRMEAGALQTVEGVELHGTEVRALVADLSEAEVRWEAAQANMGHGVPLKPSEYREVFKAFIKAGMHKGPRGQLLSYRDMSKIIGKGHTTLRVWMAKDFPRLFRLMGGPEHGNTTADAPAREVQTLADEHCEAILNATKVAKLALPQMSAQQRYLVAQQLRALLVDAERLGIEAANTVEEF